MEEANRRGGGGGGGEYRNSDSKNLLRMGVSKRTPPFFLRGDLASGGELPLSLHTFDHQSLATWDKKGNWGVFISSFFLDKEKLKKGLQVPGFQCKIQRKLQYLQCIFCLIRTEDCSRLSYAANQGGLFLLRALNREGY